ncbi:mucin-2 protein [Nocardioides sp.]|uniref:mucin-2 protein n=1 Tax=Nocardioides sp. TaxID=35761 RepID=UPI003784987D
MADHRHKRDTDARRKPRAALVAGPLALLATASAVTVGVLATSPATTSIVATGASADLGGAFTGVRQRSTISRSSERLPARRLAKADRAYEARVATQRAVKQAQDKLWTTTDLNLWSDSADSATQLGEIAAGKQVLVTGREAAGRTEVVVDGASRWVTSGYLSEDKPVAAAAGLSMAPCPDPGVEDGLVQDAVYVYRSVCHAFPQITSYGGWDAHGEHASGKALDIMTTDKALGDAIASFLQSHASELNLYDVIWWDRIWTPERASEGWRDYGNHGSPTADHMDHVHVSTN